MKAVYAIRHPHGFFKVGVSSSPFERYNHLRSGTPYDMELYAVLMTPYNDNRVEKKIHKQLDMYHWKREWFNAPKDVLDNIFEAHSRRKGFEISKPRLNRKEGNGDSDFENMSI